jgi:hypothetical protein
LDELYAFVDVLGLETLKVERAPWEVAWSREGAVVKEVLVE